jgi:hypothetical protein
MTRFCSMIAACTIVLSFGTAKADSTIALYSFETGPNGAPVTTVVDSSGNGLNGSVLSGAPTYSSNVPLGGGSFSLALNSSDSASFNYAFPFQTLTDATLQFWAYPDQLQPHTNPFWTTLGSGDTNRFNIQIENGLPAIDYRDPNGALHMLGTSSVAISAGQWSLIDFVKQSDTYSIYVNGLLTSQVTDVAPNLPTSTGWTINGRIATEPSGCCQFTGLLDEIRLSTPAAQVPGPIVGAGLPGLLFAALGMLGWRRRQRAWRIQPSAPSDVDIPGPPHADARLLAYA